MNHDDFNPSTATNTLRAVVSRTNGSEADVGEGNSGIRHRSLKLRRSTVGTRARTTLSTPASLTNGVSRVEPEHVGMSISPKREGENHAILESLAHVRQTTNVVELVVLLVEGGLLGGAELAGDGGAGVAWHDGLGVCNDLAVLDVDATDLVEEAVRAGVELGDHRDGLGAVDGEAWALAVEVLDALAIGVEVAAVSIAGSAVAVVGEGTATSVALARVVGIVDAGVRSVCCSSLVRLCKLSQYVVLVYLIPH